MTDTPSLDRNTPAPSPNRRVWEMTDRRLRRVDQLCFIGGALGGTALIAASRCGSPGSAADAAGVTGRP